MELVPVKKTLEENAEFSTNPECQESLPVTVNYFQRIGYHPPWIGYFAKKNNQLVGVAAFKGAPRNGRVEIAYGTFEGFRQQGMGAEICRTLVDLSLKTDPTVMITARTLPENNYSTRILEKNNFTLTGTVYDEEDGNVWEWEYRPGLAMTQ